MSTCRKQRVVGGRRPAVVATRIGSNWNQLLKPSLTAAFCGAAAAGRSAAQCHWCCPFRSSDQAALLAQCPPRSLLLPLSRSANTVRRSADTGSKIFLMS